MGHTHTKKKSVRDGEMGKKLKYKKGETTEKLNESYTLEGPSTFQHCQKRFVRFRVGSAHTDIGLHIHPALQL